MSRFPNESEQSFNIASSREYWRFAPSGLGKANACEMLAMDMSEFEQTWNRHYEARRFHYWEERRFTDKFRELFAGKRVLSFGSGLGFQELEFVASGADLICADIVEENLAVITRAALLKDLKPPTTVLLEGGANDDFPYTLDYVYANGSLMTMPTDLQARTMANLLRHLSPHGMIFLMLYTRRFAEQHDSVENPTKFAGFSDPDAGHLRNPWSDWHDDSKIEKLVGGKFRLLGSHEWNDGLYAWSVLSPSGANADQDPLVGCLASEVHVAGMRYDLSLADIRYHRAPAMAASPLIFEVPDCKYEYICQLEMPKLKANSQNAYEVVLECEVESGGVAVNLYNSATDSILFARGFSQQGKSEFRVLVAGTVCSQADSVILSAFNPDAPSKTRFVLRAISLREIPSGEIQCLVT